MSESPEQAVLRLAARNEKDGLPMGAIVDELVQAGHAPADVENAVWTLLQQRRLTPNGFVARTIRRRTEVGTRDESVYEFVLIPWSLALDQQLDFAFKGDVGK